MNSPALVQRLGFDAYASNIIANLIEDGLMYDGYKTENDETVIIVNAIDNRYAVTVRCYVPSMGWQTAEIVI